jgi:hypothetical protein
MRVSFANMLFSLCAEVPGADVDKITAAIDKQSAALPQRSPSQISYAASERGGPNDPELSNCPDVAALFQYQTAEVLLSPVDSTVGGGLIQVCVVEEVKHARPFRGGRAIDLDLPSRFRHGLQFAGSAGVQMIYRCDCHICSQS